MTSLRFGETWPWNPGYLRLFLLVPSLIGVGATAVLYPRYGAVSLYFLLGIPIGLALFATFRTVGRRVEALKRSVAGTDGEVAEGLIVLGKLQSPGLVILDGSELVLIPIVGERRTIALDEIVVVREGRWLPGKFVWGKRAFNLGLPDASRAAFAVAESIGLRWAARLRR